jgi:hypothetical protein
MNRSARRPRFVREGAGHSWLAWYAAGVCVTEIFIVPAVVRLVGWEMATIVAAELGVWLNTIGAIADLVRANTSERHIGGAAGGPTAGKSDRSDNRDFADLA